MKYLFISLFASLKCLAFLVVLISFSQLSVAAEKNVKRKIASGQSITCVDNTGGHQGADRKPVTFVVSGYSNVGFGPKEASSCPLNLWVNYPDNLNYIGVLTLNAVDNSDKNYPCLYSSSGIACSKP